MTENSRAKNTLAFPILVLEGKITLFFFYLVVNFTPLVSQDYINPRLEEEMFQPFGSWELPKKNPASTGSDFLYQVRRAFSLNPNLI